jgi:hypothetical protein
MVGTGPGPGSLLPRTSHNQGYPKVNRDKKKGLESGSALIRVLLTAISVFEPVLELLAVRHGGAFKVRGLLL